MRAEQLQVELHPRSPWEAMELGNALVRRHARAIWLPWLLLSLPVFVLVNALGWALGMVGWAGLVMWWLKPLFDRIPLYVLSRAVFGAAPSVRVTLAAQWHWGWRAMPGYLLWRRLGPARALYLPVDLLEGGKQAAQRRNIMGHGIRSTAVLLTTVCVHFEGVLILATFALGLMFVPVELLSESTKAAWALITQQPPDWALVLLNAVSWLAASVVEPFYVGAGFGLYLDRRTRLEAWDVEIGLRRLRTRLSATLTSLLCVLVLGLAVPAVALAAPQCPAPKQGSTLAKIFPVVADDPRFLQATAQTRKDPLLHPVRKQQVWVRKTPDDKKLQKSKDSALLNSIAKGFAFVGEFGLWIGIALLVLLLLKTRRYWWPWLYDMARPLPPPPTEMTTDAHATAEALPRDIVASVRRLWQQGRQRHALALLYRASVEAMVARTGAVLVPGATEADCLRAARALPEREDREAFGGMVRVWQYAAYAQHLPDAEGFEALLQRLALRFGWAA